MRLLLLFIAALPAVVPAVASGVVPAPAVSEPAAAPFTRAAFVAALARDLAGHYNLEGELELELLRPWSPPARPARAWSVAVLEYPAAAASSMLLRCRLLADGAPLEEQTVVVRALLWRDAWAARVPLDFGAPFDPASLETQRVDVLRERDALPAAAGDRSYIFARAIPAGRLLTWRDLSRRPLVRKGALVDVTATEGRLVVTMKALALENGAQGETITVRNPESRKDFSALVTDENHVQVRF